MTYARFDHAATPPCVFNTSPSEVLSVRNVSERLGSYSASSAAILGGSATAYHRNAAAAGIAAPGRSVSFRTRLIEWVADWLRSRVASARPTDALRGLRWEVLNPELESLPSARELQLPLLPELQPQLQLADRRDLLRSGRHDLSAGRTGLALERRLHWREFIDLSLPLLLHRSTASSRRTVEPRKRNSASEVRTPTS